MGRKEGQRTKGNTKVFDIFFCDFLYPWKTAWETIFFKILAIKQCSNCWAFVYKSWKFKCDWWSWIDLCHFWFETFDNWRGKSDSGWFEIGAEKNVKERCDYKIESKFFYSIPRWRIVYFIEQLRDVIPKTGQITA